MLVRIKYIYAAQENISPGKKLYYEKFKDEGGVYKKVATPQTYGIAHDVAYPGNSVIKKDYESTSSIGFSCEVVQNRPLLLTQLFPDGVIVDESNVEIPKPFLFVNKGGESITTNLNGITSIEISNINLLTTKALKVASVTERIEGKHKIVFTGYEKITSDYFARYDKEKTLIENFRDGVFKDLLQVETSSFTVNYNKFIDPEKVWGSNAKTVYYSPYCTLEPEKKSFKYRAWFDLTPNTYDNNLLSIRKSEQMTLDTTQAFCSIRY